jgi:excisionase family DNA binding protein
MTQEQTMDDRWFSVSEIAVHLGVKDDTVYKWIKEKRLPAHRIGRLWKLKKLEVDEWVKVSGASEAMSISLADKDLN